METKGWTNNTPLHLAAENGHTSTVEVFLKEGASIEIATSFHVTPLHCAAYYDHASTVGIDDPPLDDAVRRYHTDIAKLLRTEAAKRAVNGNHSFIHLL